MNCLRCSAVNRDGRRFCASCGAPLGAPCPSCGEVNEPSEKFCGQCGIGLTTAPRPKPAPHQIPAATAAALDPLESSLTDDGERKAVTALFADIKGSTELMEDMDPEEARTIIDPALRLMIGSVQRYDGYVVQSTGDGIFALFGAPLAHEDHPQRALYAALRMQEEMRRYSSQLRGAGALPLEARVGISTGEVVVRTIATGSAKTEYTPIGHTANLAARMQALAPTGSIALSETTRSLVEGYFTLRSLGPTKVKGITGPVQVYEAIGLGPLRSRLQRSAGRGLSKFVGRRREMEVLRSALDQASSGRGQVVAVEAQPGVGKSRLFHEFKAVSQRGCMVLEAFSVSHGKASPYLPILDLLHTYFGITPEDDERRRREKVNGRLVTLDPALLDTCPYLFALLGLANDDRALREMDATVRNRLTLEAVRRILFRESVVQPLILIFEDLHWIDEATQELLDLVLESIDSARIAMLVNYRPEYDDRWTSRPCHTRLRLEPLETDGAEEMMSTMIGGGTGLAALRRLIIDKTGGTPFFMEETVQALFEDGTLAHDGVVRLTKPLAELRIPASVQAILAARIDRLAPAAKGLLQTLAIIGRELPVSLVRAVVSTPHDELDRRLQDLQLGEFIYEQPAVGDTLYVFQHALTQEVAYNSVLMERRRPLHQRIGAAYEALYANSIDDYLPQLAHHYGRSGDLDRAVEYLTRSAKRKMEASLRVERRLAQIVGPDAREQDAVMAQVALVRGEAREPMRLEDRTTDAVEALWRYPVKSMAGERLDSAMLTPLGMLGDRAYAVVEAATNCVATVRTWGAVLQSYRTNFDAEPQPGTALPAVQIRSPGGLAVSSSDADANEQISAAFGRGLAIVSTVPAGLQFAFPKGTVGGAHSQATLGAIGGGAPAGVFVDYGCLHLLATCTVDHLQALYPQGLFDIRRFRPNIVIRSDGEPFVENSWVGHRIAIGDEAVLNVTVPCPRCVNMILAQNGLPHDPGILRTIAQHNMLTVGEFGVLPCAGVYADVVRAGTIRQGDTVRYLD